VFAHFADVPLHILERRPLLGGLLMPVYVFISDSYANDKICQFIPVLRHCLIESF
jgi:hypothetical protein